MCWTGPCWFCARSEESSVRPWRWTGRWSATMSRSSPSSISWTAWVPTPVEPCNRWGLAPWRETTFHTNWHLYLNITIWDFFAVLEQLLKPSEMFISQVRFLNIATPKSTVFSIWFPSELNWTTTQRLWASPSAWSQTCAASLTLWRSGACTLKGPLGKDCYMEHNHSAKATFWWFLVFTCHPKRFEFLSV